MTTIMLGIIIVLFVVDIAIHLTMYNYIRKDKKEQQKKKPQTNEHLSLESDKNQPTVFVSSLHKQSNDVVELASISQEKHQLPAMEEVRNTFTLQEIIAAYQSGELGRRLSMSGEEEKLRRLQKIKIPVQGKLAKDEKMQLCEVIFPKWADIPGRIQQDLDDRDCRQEDTYPLSDEQLDQIWRSFLRRSQSSLSIRKQSDEFDCLIKFDDHICYITKDEMGRLFHKNNQEELGEAVYRFINTEPLCMRGRDLGYVVETLIEYIFNIARFYYDTNSRQIIYKPQISAAIMFNDSQPMSDSHMVTIEHSSFASQNDGDDEKKQFYPSYRFDKEQLGSLIGLSRIDIASKILNWLNEAHLMKSNH